MASPTFTVPTSPHSSGSGTTSRVVSFGATLDAGDGLLLFTGARDGAVTPPGGSWDDLFVEVVNNFNMRAMLLEAGGGETEVTLTVESAVVLMAYPIRIAAGTWDPSVPPEWTLDTFTADPPSETASFGAAENGWVTGHVNNHSSDVSTFPTGFADNQRAHGSAFDTMHMAMCTKQDDVATLNPTAFSPAGGSRMLVFTMAFKGAAGVDLAQLSEADSLLAVTSRKSLPIAIQSDTASLHFLSAAKALPIAQVSETDEVLAFSGSIKSQPLAQLSEADELLPLGASPEEPLGIITEVDSAIALAGSVKSKPLDVVVETDSLFGLTGIKSLPLGILTETDSALLLGTAIPLSILVETDALLALLGGSLPYGGTAKTEGLKLRSSSTGLVRFIELKAKSSGFRPITRSSGLEISI